MSRMFPFITKTWNPFKGRCPYECSYCWARSMAKRYKHLKEKYFTDEQGIDEKQINRKFKPGAFVFVQDMSDASSAPFESVCRVIDVIKKNPEVNYLFLTKNPEIYFDWIDNMSLPWSNLFLGATVETTDADLIQKHSKAPPPHNRLKALYDLSVMGFKTFISVEPIMEFDRTILLRAISLIRPWAVAVGYDNYHNDLSEPSLKKTQGLIEDLEKRRITVYRKTLRESISSKELRRSETK